MHVYLYKTTFLGNCLNYILELNNHELRIKYNELNVFGNINYLIVCIHSIWGLLIIILDIVTFVSISLNITNHIAFQHLMLMLSLYTERMVNGHKMDVTLWAGIQPT